MVNRAPLSDLVTFQAANICSKFFFRPKALYMGMGSTSFLLNISIVANNNFLVPRIIVVLFGRVVVLFGTILFRQRVSTAGNIPISVHSTSSTVARKHFLFGGGRLPIEHFSSPMHHSSTVSRNENIFFHVD